ncbi:MAG: hypothetical protein AAGF58_08045 [Pseudomonadota bacterium]
MVAVPERHVVFWIAVVAGCVVYYLQRDNQIFAAWSGFNVTVLADPYWLKANASLGYPNGEEQLVNSLPYWILVQIGNWRPIEQTVHGLVVALELFAVAFAAFFSCRLLNKTGGSTAALLVALFLIAGHLVNADLSRWFYPFYGAPYSFAIGFGLLGSALAIAGRMKLAAVLLCLSIMCHPIIGAIFCFFSAVAILSALRRYPPSTLVWGALIGLALLAVWFGDFLLDPDVSAGEVPADGFIALSKMMGYHWFPLTIGSFGSLHDRHLTPFLAYCLLATHYLYGQSTRIAGMARQIAIGLAALFVLSFAGVFASEFSGSPFLVKMSLGRASLILMIIGALFVVPGLWKDLTGRTWRSVLAAMLLVTPFFAPAGLATLWVLGLVVPKWVLDLQHTGLTQRGYAVGITLLTCFTGLAWVSFQGFPIGLQTTAVAGRGTLSNIGFLLAVGIVLVTVFLAPLRSSQAVIIAVLGISAVSWTDKNARFSSLEQKETAQAYLEVQEWARQNTDEDALFMPDPAHAYGWRQYAQRPSFGGVRDWLYVGWIYKTNPDIYNEGIRRFEEFGMTVGEAIAQDNERPGWARNALSGLIRDQYYAAERGWFESLANRYEIDYFIFEKKFISEPLPLPVSFENQQYIVARRP